jgi:tRNA(Ile)-lysidine synthase
MAYVNHGTRASAWQDECVVLRLGAAFGVPVRVAVLDGTARDESSLRDARYAALTRIAREEAAGAIATAHHREDQSETVLLALFRGAGPDGLAGMRARRALEPGIDLARPLLKCGEAELRYACQTHALPYAVDPTNADAGIRRNAVREALGALRPLFPGLDAAIARTADVLSEELAGTRRAELRRRVRETLAEEAGLRDVDFQHVEAAVRAMERGRSGRFHMKKSVILSVSKDEVEID